MDKQKREQLAAKIAEAAVVAAPSEVLITPKFCLRTWRGLPDADGVFTQSRFGLIRGEMDVVL